MPSYHGGRLGPQAYGCFLVAARAESSAIRKLVTHWRYADSLGIDRHSGSNPIAHFLTAEGFRDSVPVEMACFELAGASGTRTSCLPKLSKNDFPLLPQACTLLHCLARPST